MKNAYAAEIRKQIEETGMSIIEYAKDCLHNGDEYAEAIACDCMTYAEREAFRAYKIEYLAECLKDCPF